MTNNGTLYALLTGDFDDNSIYITAINVQLRKMIVEGVIQGDPMGKDSIMGKVSCFDAQDRFSRDPAHIKKKVSELAEKKHRFYIGRLVASYGCDKSKLEEFLEPLKTRFHEFSYYIYTV